MDASVVKVAIQVTAAGCPVAVNEPAGGIGAEGLGKAPPPGTALVLTTGSTGAPKTVR